MAASIFNQGMYHAFVVADDGTLYERWDNPPVQWGAVPGTTGGFDPSYPLSISRVDYDPKSMFYPLYFVSGRAKSNHVDPVIALWAGNQWLVYGG